MFGLENQKKKKKAEPFVFDLEKEFKDNKRRQEVKQHMESRIQQVKDVLRSGDSKEEFDLFGLLLHGYTSVLKVMSRFTAGKA